MVARVAYMCALDAACIAAFHAPAYTRTETTTCRLPNLQETLEAVAHRIATSLWPTASGQHRFEHFGEVTESLDADHSWDTTTSLDSRCLDGALGTDDKLENRARLGTGSRLLGCDVHPWHQRYWGECGCAQSPASIANRTATRARAGATWENAHVR